MRLSPLRTTALIAFALTLAAGGCNSGGQRGLTKVRYDADWAYNRGDYTRAAADYQEYMDRRPGDPEIAYRLAKSYLETDQPTRAIGFARMALDQAPERDEYLALLAEAYFQAGDIDGLYRLLRTQTADRGRVEDYLRLGYYAAKLGHADEAELALLTGAKIDQGRTAGPQLALADFYASIGDQEAATRRLRMALYVDRTNEEILQKLRTLGEIPGPSLALRPEEAP